MLKGMKRGDISISYGKVKGRVKPCLSITEGNHQTVVATFINEEKAELFFKAVDYIFNGGDFTLKGDKNDM